MKLSFRPDIQGKAAVAIDGAAVAPLAVDARFSACKKLCKRPLS